MLTRSISAVLLPSALITFGLILVPADFAKVQGVASKPPKEPVVETVRLSRATTINRAVVEPGQYKLTARGYELRLEAPDGRTVARSPITWRRVDHTFDDTKMDIDHDILTRPWRHQ